MLLKNLLDGLEILDEEGKPDIEVSGIAYDSREVKDGNVFVCMTGADFDGHDFIQDAISRGAKAVITQREVSVPPGITFARVDDTRFALAFISDVFYDHPSRKFTLIGVTGTKGKTTTAFMIKSILEAAGQKVGLIGTVAKMIGKEVLHAEGRTTPESYDLQTLFAEMAEKKVDSVVMEVSSQGLQLHRVSCCDFDTGVFTNLSRDHIGPREHKSFEEYLNAKIKLFKICKRGIVNIDSSYGEEVRRDAGCDVLTYGIAGNADIKAFNINEHPECVKFTVKTPWLAGEIAVNIPGRFSVYNALAAIGTCGAMGIGSDTIKTGLGSVQVKGRAEIVETGKDFTVMIDYAHNPDSLENILTTVKSYARGRVVCLFGCGGNRERPRALMGETVGRFADFTIITSDNPRREDPVSIIRDIESGIKRTNGEYITVVERREAIRYAIENARPGDVIILAGKGHETYQEFHDRKIQFDEREVVREILEDISANR